MDIKQHAGHLKNYIKPKLNLKYKYTCFMGYFNFSGGNVFEKLLRNILKYVKNSTISNIISEINNDYIDQLYLAYS